MLIAAMGLFLVTVCSPAPARVHVQYAIRGSQDRVYQDASMHGDMASQVAAELAWLRTYVGGDFRVTPGTLTVWIYGSHTAFSRALWRARRQRPQSAQDNTSSVAHNTLILGPLDAAYRRHNLAHVYAEWVMDRLTGNVSDRLPDGTWLYDGLAEYEAYRYVPGALHCGGSGQTVMDVTTIRTARDWMNRRPGPLGSLEYCLAYLEVRGLVAARGWASIVRTLRSHRSWEHMAADLDRAVRDRTTRPPGL